jgi:hypothetical protein
MGKPMIMGRKTFESLPGLLPGRRHIGLSRRDGFTAEGVEIAGSVKEALELGREVRHFSGEEGIDELWGEPFRAFTLPITAYYESRFIKVAQTMANIDKVCRLMCELYTARPEFQGIAPLIKNYASAARHECETMKADIHIFEIWPRLIATGEVLAEFQPDLQAHSSRECRYVMEEALKTLIAGRNLINWIARARVPMPRSTAAYIARCDSLRERFTVC